MSTTPGWDVIVVGGGSAGMCAALAAREAGARVLVLEKAPKAWRGGNSFFTAGAFRFAFASFEELRSIMGDLSDEEAAQIDVAPYTEDAYYDDLMRVTEDCADPDLALVLVRESQPTVRWLKDRIIRWIPMFGCQAFKVGGRFRFWGGLVLEAVGGGPGLIEMEYAAAEKAGVDVRFEAKAMRLLTDDRGAVTGVVVRTPRGTETLTARAVVVAAGGFEANVEMRALSGPPLGSRLGAGDAVQHRWRHSDGARRRRSAVGPLERLSRRPLGLQRPVARVQRSRPAGRVRPGREGRQAHLWHRPAEIQLGTSAGHAPLCRLRGDDRHHLHVRRAAHHVDRPSLRPRAAADSRALCRR